MNNTEHAFSQQVNVKGHKTYQKKKKKSKENELDSDIQQLYASFKSHSHILTRHRVRLH